MGVYLYSVDDPPESHVQFMEEQVLWIWTGSMKFLQLGGEDFF